MKIAINIFWLILVTVGSMCRADATYIQLRLEYGDGERSDISLYMQVERSEFYNVTLSDIVNNPVLSGDKRYALQLFLQLNEAALSGSAPLVEEHLNVSGLFHDERSKSFYPKLLIDVAHNFDPGSLVIGLIADISPRVFIASMHNPDTGYKGTAIFRKDTDEDHFRKVFFTYDSVSSCINYYITEENILDDLPPGLSKAKVNDKAMGETVAVYGKVIDSVTAIESEYPEVAELIKVYRGVIDADSFEEFCSSMYQQGDWACKNGFDKYKSSNLHRHAYSQTIGMLDLDPVYVVFYNRSGSVPDAFYLIRSGSNLYFINQNTKYPHETIFRQGLWSRESN